MITSGFRGTLTFGYTVSSITLLHTKLVEGPCLEARQSHPDPNEDLLMPDFQSGGTLI